MTTRCIGGFCAVVLVISFALHISEYNAFKDMLETGSVSTVQGYVENYSPLPWDGKGTENFEINGVYFAYNNADARNGYTKTANRGGVITHNGQHLIIRYVTREDGENIILYISNYQVLPVVCYHTAKIGCFFITTCSVGIIIRKTDSINLKIFRSFSVRG